MRDLVDRGRLELREIRISSLLGWLWPRAREQRNSLVELCSLLEMAARLALLKARRMTGEWEQIAEEEGSEWAGPPPELPLRRSWLAQRIAEGPFSFVGSPHAFEGAMAQLAPVSPAALHEAMLRVLKREPPTLIAASPVRPRMSVEHSSQRILAALEGDGELVLDAVAGESRDERIAAFLACLTLARQGRVSLTQDDLFGEIRIRSATAALQATA
jgi:chromatin segregation and condensation protein Rec8/ScpA/Scc1 (kleisin family)